MTGAGSFFAGSFLASMAGTVLGSVIAQHFFNTHADAAQLFGDIGHHANDSGLDSSGSGGNDLGDGGDIVSDFGGDDTFDV